MANLNGNDGNNILTGGRAADRIDGRGGHDILTGAGGVDLIYGRGGTDFLIGGPGNDTLFGGADLDILWGGNGDDTIAGENGHDIIYGGTGNDELFGGRGRDTFVFNSNQPGIDIIRDFEPDIDAIDAGGVRGGLDWFWLNLDQADFWEVQHFSVGAVDPTNSVGFILDGITADSPGVTLDSVEQWLI